jgi:4-amino-4-deoxy-L-arabinose transferase-like glycosyltransferase
MTQDRRHFLYLMLAATVLLAAGLGLRDPWPPDEPRFALIAKDMVESGNWLIPRVGGVLYPDKPPLFFWLVACFYALSKSIRVAVLLPAFFSGLGVLWLVHDLARRLWNPEAALWCGAALLATVQFPLQMKAGQIDGFLCLWTTLGLYGLCRHLLLGPDWRWYAIGGLACGLGVITKGVGFLPLLVLLPWLYALRCKWPLPEIGRSHGKWLLAPLALVLAISLWLVPMLVATGDAADPEFAQYRDNILLKQTVTRYADSWGHLKPPWYLFTNAIPWLWLPLSFLLPWLIPQWARNLKLQDSATLLFAAWLLLVLLFFSLSDGKRSVYIFPALPALALLAGRHLPAILARRGPKRMVFALGFLLAALPTAAGIYALFSPPLLQDWLDRPGAATAVAAAIVASGLLATALVFAFRLQHAAKGFAAAMAILWLTISLFIYPRIDATRSGRAIIDVAETALAPDVMLAFAGWKEQMLLQWNRPAVHFGYRREDVDEESRDAASWLAGNDSRRLLLPDELVPQCFDRSRLMELGFAHRRYWFLASAGAVLAVCRESTSTASLVLYDPANMDAGRLKTARQLREKAPAAARFPP